jgi:hypothetical protein
LIRRLQAKFDRGNTTHEKGIFVLIFPKPSFGQVISSQRKCIGISPKGKFTTFIKYLP